MNFGEERHYQRYVEISSTDGRKVRELPSFYAEFEENKDPPGIFFSPVSTVNIPDTKLMLQSYLMKEKRNLIG